MTEIQLGIRLTADGNVAVTEVRKVKDEVRGLGEQARRPVPDNTEKLREGAKRTSGVIKELQGQLLALASLGAISQFVRSSIRELARAESSFRGLESVANFTGVGIGRAFKEAEKLAADGLMSIADASKSLQNLLSRGYGLEQAVEVLTRLKDAAAFNRAAQLSMSAAVVSATEGLKNENSILVDNAGVTKNVSKMWEEYAKQVGKTANDLTIAEKIQAEYNGIMAETQAQAGNAAGALNTLQGQLALAEQESIKFKASLGEALTPAVIELTRVGTYLINNFLDPALKGFQIVGAAAAAVGIDIKTVWEALATFNFTGMTEKLAANAKQFEDTVAEIANRRGVQFAPLPSSGARRTTSTTSTTTPKTGGGDIADYVRQIKEQLALNQDSTTVEKVLFDLRERHWKNASPALRQQAVDLAKQLDQKIAAKAALDAENETLEKQDQIRQEVANTVGKMRSEALLAADEAARALEFENDLIGKTNVERERSVALQELERRRVLLTAEAYEEYRRRIDAAYDVKAQKLARQKILDDTKAAQTRLNEDLQRGLTDSIFRGFEAGKPFAENFRDSLVNMFKTTILRPVIQWIISPVTGALTAALGGLGIPGLANAAGGATGAGSILGSMGGGFSGIGNVFGALSGGANAIFQNAGAAMGSQFIADIGNFGFGVPVLSGLTMAAMGDVKGGFGATLGGIAGSYFGPVGAAVGSAIGGALLGGSSKGGPASWTGYDVSGQISRQGFAGDFFGTARNSKTGFRWQQAPDIHGPGSASQVYAAFSDVARQAFADVERIGGVLGLDTNRLGAATVNLSGGALVGQGLTEFTEQFRQAVAGASNELALQLMPNLRQFAVAGESAAQTLVRLAATAEQLRGQEEQSLAGLRGHIRALPGQLGITGLEAFRSSLQVSDTLAPLDRLAGARALYEGTLSGALGGDLTQVQAFPQIAQQLLGIGRDVYASGPQFASLFTEVNRSLNDVLGRQQGIQNELLAGIDLTIIEQSRDQIAEIRRVTDALVTGHRQIVDALRELTAAQAA